MHRFSSASARVPGWHWLQRAAAAKGATEPGAHAVQPQLIWLLTSDAAARKKPGSHGVHAPWLHAKPAWQRKSSLNATAPVLAHAA